VVSHAVDTFGPFLWIDTTQRSEDNMQTLGDRLLPVLLRHHWLVTHDDVAEAGGTEAQIGRRVRDGRWLRVDRGVYWPSQAPTSWEARVLAPILGAPQGVRVLASDTTAAVLHGVPGFGRGRPELSVERPYNLRRSGVRIRTSSDLERCTAVEIDGIPTTDLPRTLLDLGRTVGDARLLRAVEWSRREKGVMWSDLITTLAHHARRGRGGIQRLRRIILANAHREEVTDTDVELLVLSLLSEAGLPDPVLHHQVRVDGRVVAEIDLAYPALRIAIEIDGTIHLREDVWNRDLPRQNFLVLEGWTILRFNRDGVLDHPDRIVAEVRAAIRRSSATPGAA
jgi:very-short-patch-repair endonuclease